MRSPGIHRPHLRDPGLQYGAVVQLFQIDLHAGQHVPGAAALNTRRPVLVVYRTLKSGMSPPYSLSCSAYDMSTVSKCLCTEDCMEVCLSLFARGTMQFRVPIKAFFETFPGKVSKKALIGTRNPLSVHNKNRRITLRRHMYIHMLMGQLRVPIVRPFLTPSSANWDAHNSKMHSEQQRIVCDKLTLSHTCAFDRP